MDLVNSKSLYGHISPAIVRMHYKYVTFAAAFIGFLYLQICLNLSIINSFRKTLATAYQSFYSKVIELNVKQSKRNTLYPIYPYLHYVRE